MTAHDRRHNSHGQRRPFPQRPAPPSARRARYRTIAPTTGRIYAKRHANRCADERGPAERSGELPTDEVVHRVISHNPGYVLGDRASRPVQLSAPERRRLRRLPDAQRARAEAACSTARSMPRDPDLALLAQQNEKPAGIYVWASMRRGVARRRNAADGREDFNTALSRRRCLCARGDRPTACSSCKRSGFEPNASYAGSHDSASSHVSAR